MKPFRTQLEERDALYGIFAKTNDPFFIEAIGRAGFDFVVLDNEHGPNSVRELYPLITAAETSGLYPIVRVGKLSDIEIQRTLDLGPAGVQIPQVQSRKDAELVSRYAKFHPEGLRGMCRFVRAAEFSLKERSSYFKEQNERTVVVHIEGREGIEALDEIITVKNIDVIFIGPYDLSQSLGVPGQIDNPLVCRHIEQTAKRCLEHGKYVGIFTDTFEAARHYASMGVKYITYSVDVGIFADALSSALNELRR